MPQIGPPVQAKGSIIDYIEIFYNSQRRHSYLKYLTPMEFEKKLTLQKVALKNFHVYLTSSNQPVNISVNNRR
uniref:IS3 family transposase n=1 Tax=Desulfomarina profundi TaxID=2772557 RepID=UPI0038B34028